VKLTRDYFSQIREQTPVFDPADYPEVAGQIDLDIWNEHVGRQADTQTPDSLPEGVETPR
jgi:hypothetical protein